MPLVRDDDGDWILEYQKLLELREEQNRGASRATKSRPRADLGQDAAKALEALGWRVVRAAGEDPRVYLVGAPPGSDVGAISRAFAALRVIDPERDTVVVGSAGFAGVGDIDPIFTLKQDADLHRRDAEAARQITEYGQAVRDSIRLAGPGKERATRLARVLAPRTAHACRQWLTRHEGRVTGKLMPAIRLALAHGRVLAIVTTDDLLRPTLMAALTDAGIAALVALPAPRRTVDAAKAESR